VTDLKFYRNKKAPLEKKCFFRGCKAIAAYGRSDKEDACLS